jgi:VanZ family protein
MAPAAHPSDRGRSSLWLIAWYWGPLALYAVAIFVLSSMTHPPVPVLPVRYADKLLHMVEYAGLGGLLTRALALGGRGLSARAAVAASLGLAALYGVSDELHQSFVPHRSADPLDWLADILGAAGGSLLYSRLRLRARVQSPPRCEPEALRERGPSNDSSRV